MADLKISQLTALATFADDDLLAIVDTSATETKKVEWGAMKTALASVFWKLDGNTVGSEKWIGTIDNFDFPIRTNNVQIAEFSAAGNFGIGVAPNAAYRLHSKGSGTTSTTYNFFTESNDGFSFAHNDDGEIYRSGNLWSRATSGGNPLTTWGQGAGLSCSISAGATMIGFAAGSSLASGNGFVALGDYALTSATVSSNTGVGAYAGRNHTTGHSCTYIGFSAGYPAGAGDNATGNYNTVIGTYALVGGNYDNVLSICGVGTGSNQIQFGGATNINNAAVCYYSSLSVSYTSGLAKQTTYYRTSTPESAQVGTMGDIAYVNTGAAGQVFIKATGTATNTGWVQLSTASGTFLTTDGATTGATSQAQVFTNGIKTPFIDDNAAGSIELSFSGTPLFSFSSGSFQIVPLGSAVAPSLAIGPANSGFYETAGSTLGASVTGALVGGFDATGLFAGLAGTLTGTMKFNGATSGTVTVQSAAAAGTWTLTLPTTDGNSGEFLQTNGSGVTTWAVPAGTGANVALSNLAAVAINTTLLPGSNDGAALGSGTLSFSDLFLASGAVVNFANGNSVITHSSAVLTVSTGDLRVTTAGTNATSVATLAGTQTLTNKSIVATQLTGTAYTMAVNNTSGTAAYTLTNYRNDVIADFDGTFTWNSTPPSTIVSQKYVMSRIGNMVILTISVLYTSTGTTNTTCIVTFPSTAPAPAVLAASGDTASEYMYPISGARVEANQTANPSAIGGCLRRNSGDSAFEILLIFGSTSALQLQVTVIYFTA